MGIKRSMSSSLLKALAQEAAKEWPLSRETVSRCYYSHLSSPPSENASTSELWVNVIWERSQSVPIELFRAALKSNKKLGELGKHLEP